MLTWVGLLLAALKLVLYLIERAKVNAEVQAELEALIEKTLDKINDRVERAKKARDGIPPASGDDKLPTDDPFRRD